MVWLAGDKPDLKRLPKIWSKKNSLFLGIKMATLGSISRIGNLSLRRSHYIYDVIYKHHALFCLSFCSRSHCIISLFMTAPQKVSCRPNTEQSFNILRRSNQENP